MKIQIVAEIPCVASQRVLLGDTCQSWVVSPAAPRPFYFYYYVVDWKQHCRFGVVVI